MRSTNTRVEAKEKELCHMHDVDDDDGDDDYNHHHDDDDDLVKCLFTRTRLRE